ncbi:hypothetical protein VNF293_43240 (plasmid) [Atlantibacter hermannii]
MVVLGWLRGGGAALPPILSPMVGVALPHAVAYDARALGCGLLPCVLCRRWFSSLTIGGASLQALPYCRHKKARIARAFWLYLFIYPNQSKRRINANGDPYRMRGGCSAGRQYVSGGINCGYMHAII